jgi:tetratricopeptide (TPR) repeat protein
MAARALLILFATLVISCARDQEAAKWAYLKSGDQYFADGKYAEAIVQYRNAVQRDPRFGEARFKLAEAYVRIHDGEGAYREYVRAADLMPTNIDAQLKAGQALLLARRFDDAAARADKVLEDNPKNVQARILRGIALANLKDLDSAIAQIEEAISVDPGRGATYDNLARLRLAQGNQQGAEEAFARAVKLDAASVPARLAQATFYLSMRRGADAEAALQETLRLDSANLTANRLLALFYLAANQAVAAEPYLKKFAEVSTSVEARLGLADYYVLMNRKREAVDIIKSLNSRDPKVCAATQTRLAAIAQGDGRVADARVILDDVLVRQPKYSPALLLKSRFFETEHELDNALTQARAATLADPRSVQAQFQLGRLHAQLNQFVEAEKAFAEVLALNPRAAAARLELARVQLAAGHVDASIQTVRQALSDLPADPFARLLLARGLIARRELSQAHSEMSALIARYPHVAAVHSQMGILALARGDRAAARKAFERALALDGGSLEALTGLVNLDLAERKGSDARARMDSKLEQAPNDARLMRLAATIDAATGERARAEQRLHRVIDIEPADLQARAMLGHLLMAEQKLDEARVAFDALAKASPDSREAIASQTMIAEILEAQNRSGDARTQYERVLASSPGTIVAANNLAWLYAERGGNLDVALGLAQTAAQRAPDRPEINDTLGWIYYKKHLTGQAIAALERSIAKDTTNPLYHYHLGLAYAMRGDLIKAKRSLEKALTLNPDFVGAADARKVLASIAG